MTLSFHDLVDSAFHRVSISPLESPTTQLIGSDIVLHLPVLEWFASQCDHVTEFGTRDGQSTVALIAGCGKFVKTGMVESYDIEKSGIVDVLSGMTLPCSWKFHQENTGRPIDYFEETDMLFIDTLHTYAHVTNELLHHGRKAKKFLAFHDSYTCAEHDLSGPNPNARGILPAILEFMGKYESQYKIVYETNRNNGLMVLERVF